MKPAIRVGLVLLTLAAIAVAKDPDDKHPQQTNGVRRFVRGMFNPLSFVRAGAAAGIGQANDTPHEWGQGMAGFGRRFGSAVGRHVVGYSIHYAVATARHEEMGYRPSGRVGFKPRLQYALLSTVITRKTTTGEKTIAVGELSGAFGSGLISRAWQPASTASVSSGIATGGISLGVDAGIHVVREFWPEIRHPRQHRNQRQQQGQPNLADPVSIQGPITSDAAPASESEAR
jgi:hypothetical protein